MANGSEPQEGAIFADGDFGIIYDAERELYARKLEDLKKYKDAQKRAYEEVLKFRKEQEASLNALQLAQLQKLRKEELDALKEKTKDTKAITKLNEERFTAEQKERAAAAKFRAADGHKRGKMIREEIAADKRQRDLLKYRIEQGEKLSNQEKEQLETLDRKVKAAEKQAKLNEQSQTAVNFTVGAVKKLNKAADEGLDKVFRSMDDYKALIDTRFLGTGKDYDSLSRGVSSQLMLSPYITTQKVLEQMSTLAQHGISYNIEQRAFLASISDKIASTFDAFDSNLTRLIKLQQSDSTAARLGLESVLTEYLNRMFEDSSYMEGQFDAVAGNILEATSQLTRDKAIAFDATAQKWLGSLYALGLSSNAVNAISTGIGYLGSGNVTALAGSDTLQTLLAMSSSRAGLPYASMLTNGLDAESTNALLKSMVEYLKEIAEGDNQVVKSAYGDVLGLTVSDFKAIANLSSKDIGNIYKQQIDAATAMSALNTQMGQISSRLSNKQMLDNLINNVQWGIAEGLANNPVMYLMYRALGLAEGMAGDHEFELLGMGTGGSISMGSLFSLIKGGLVATSALGKLVTSIGSMFYSPTLDLSTWAGNEYTSRGEGLALVATGTSSGTSATASVLNASVDDMESTTMDQAQQTRKDRSGQPDDQRTVDDLYKAFFGSSDPDTIRPVLITMESDDLSIKQVISDAVEQALTEKFGFSLSGMLGGAIGGLIG